MKRFTLIAFGVMTLSGCVSTDLSAVRARFQSTVPTCSTPEDCKVKWEASQAWMATSLPLKVQMVTDTIIQTYNPCPNCTQTAAQVVKMPRGGSYAIVIKTWCNNIFGCFPDTWQAAQSFNDYVNSVSGAPPPSK
jgi:hypothetical protein